MIRITSISNKVDICSYLTLYQLSTIILSLVSFLRQ